MSPAPSVQMAQAVPLGLMTAASNSAGNITTTGIDILDYDGVVEFVMTAGSITGSISTPRIQHSDTSGGTYTDIDQAGQAFSTSASTVSSVKVNVGEIKRWVRFAVTVTTGPALLSMTMHGFKKYR